MAQKKSAFSGRQVAVIMAIGAAVVLLSNLIDSSEPSTATPKTAPTSTTSTAFSLTKPSTRETFVVPNVVGMTGYDANNAVESAAGYRVSTTFDDAVPVECTSASPISSRIMRTEPPAGTELPASNDTIVTLFADRSAGATTCAPLPVAPPPSVKDVPNLDVDMPDPPHFGCTFVDAYIRKDGVHVRGHWRC
ncbi:PASTA domain-containing protein [Mycolicibacterium sp. 018/SC-01/001]|uniref:PASTA domain-containing protein n=1 Tax=Mycolicibacterium sp. 018/SC-01/001 TaxID=2592069 RepID=UPI00163DE330|nr:PASTA domain-containing protein [Mycolicibacterium sp. 018/SC-01/001]